MRRRRFLQASGLGVSAALLSGCLSRVSLAPDGPAHSGSGHSCDNPRNIDYDAVDEYQDHGVYLENSAEQTHTACVIVRKEDRDGEEPQSSPSPLERTGYAIQPEMAVEIHRFSESGQFVIEVSMEDTTKTESFEITDATFDDGKTRVITFEITDPDSIRVAYSGDS